MPFEEYTELVDPPITLPIKGKKYVLPPVSAKAGAEILGVIRDPNSELAQQEDPEGLHSIHRLLTKKLADQMFTDGVPYDAVLRAAMVQMSDFLYGREAAETAWRQSGTQAMFGPPAPEAPAPKRGSRSATARTRTTSTGAASTTKRRASGTGTRSQGRAR